VESAAFIKGNRHRSFEALRPDDQHVDATAERARGDQAFVRLSDVLSADLDCRLCLSRRAAKIPCNRRWSGTHLHFKSKSPSIIVARKAST
jgi:hypothetical protein